MTFWFCQSCKKIWHSHIDTPEKIKTIRCFYCMKNASIRLKEDRLTDKRFKYRNYDNNTREFLRVKREKLARIKKPE